MEKMIKQIYQNLFIQFSEKSLLYNTDPLIFLIWSHCKISFMKSLFKINTIRYLNQSLAVFGHNPEAALLLQSQVSC